MKSYKQVSSRVNNLNKKLKQEYFSRKFAYSKGNVKDTWNTITLLLNERSKNTNIYSINVDGQDIEDGAEIAQSMD